MTAAQKTQPLLDGMPVAPLSDEDRLHVRLLQVRHCVLGAWWNFRDVQNDYWRLWCNDRAGASIVCAGRRWQLPAKRVVLVPAGVAFSTSPGVGVRHHFIHFEPLALTSQAGRGLFAAPLVLPHDPLTWALIEQLSSPMEFGDELELVCHAKAMVYHALGRMLHALPVVNRSACLTLITRRTPLSPAIHAIESALIKTPTVDGLARLCGLSRDGFFRAFKASFGETPGEYVRRRRVARAAQLLSTTEGDIAGIAEACGFATRYHFTRVFTRLMGQPPAAWRRHTHDAWIQPPV